MADGEDELLEYLAVGFTPAKVVGEFGLTVNRVYGRARWDAEFSVRLDAALMRGRPDPSAFWHGLSLGHYQQQLPLPGVPDVQEGTGDFPGGYVMKASAGVGPCWSIPPHWI